MHMRFWWENLRERYHLDDPGTDGRIILKWIFSKLDGAMDWIALAQKRDRWRVLINMLRYLWVPNNVRIS